MKYKNCPSCMAQNRAEDLQCYSCQKAFQAEAVPLNEVSQAAPAAKVVNKSRDSNFFDGLEAGAKVGLVTGMVLGGLEAIHPGQNTVANILAMRFAIEMFYCVVIGSICGVMNLLGYRYDCMRIGGTFGFIYALMTFDILFVFRGSLYGSFVGWWCCHALKVKRGQYSEI